VASTATTITTTDVNLASGVTAVNGLKFGNSVTGVLSKRTAQTWSSVAALTGTAGYFRFIGSIVDTLLTDTLETQVRIDGSISTSGGDLNLTSTAIASGATQTISQFDLTIPAS